ncbi:hypothetical protein FG93_01156 [Bosea sp. LC85]|uniref:hypothetical protein n=1 Tax=Bosea sp. LC85 TaxID=1502851 RepID=UPI0004E3B545|nr:hypothetical protein [Bosea sp. LC85]KFC74570.1 hypothetical protein FG93_01156 [Bosea sp. LC85]
MSPRFLLLACTVCQPAFVGVASASSCAERMAALEIRINQAAEAAASASSGGQGVAAARESQAMQSRDQGQPIAPDSVPPFQQEGKEAAATRQAAQAGATASYRPGPG